MAERKKPVDIPAINNPPAEQAFRFFCKHLVSLVCRCDPVTPDGRPGGPAQCFAFSGQVLSARGGWFLLTAGHILRGIEQRREAGGWQMQFFLADCFGPEVVNHDAIPFDYESAQRAHLDEQGLDFGLVALRPYYRALLEKNGVTPIVEEHWARQHEVECDRHFMIGFPAELGQTSVVRTPRGYQVSLTFCPALVSVSRLDQPPADCEPTPYGRFVGQIGHGGLDDIDGMSGCPIFGLQKGRDDLYWIVAVQGSWLRQRRIVFGTPVPLLGAMVERALLALEQGE